MKSFIDYMNEHRAPRTVYEQRETEGLAKVFDEIGLDGDDLIKARARNHPTFFLRCHWENHMELAAFKRLTPVNGKILDFGCGSGHLTTMAAELGFEIDGVDELPSAISVAYHISENSLANRKPFFWQADVTKVRLEGKYDLVWSTHVFEHIENPEGVLLALKNWVKPGGQILISVPYGNAYADPSHVHHWHSAEAFRDFVSPWLEIVLGEVDTNPNEGCIRALCKFK